MAWLTASLCAGLGALVAAAIGGALWLIRAPEGPDGDDDEIDAALAEWRPPFEGERR